MVYFSHRIRGIRLCRCAGAGFHGTARCFTGLAMTTRSYTINQPALYESYSAVGSDGKYETFGGKTRTKWNNYTLNRRKEKRTKSSTGNYMSCTASTPVDLDNYFQANDTVTVQSRLSELIKGHDFNLAVNVAQGKQTTEMVVAALGSLGNAIRDVKRGNFASAARRLGVPPRPNYGSTVKGARDRRGSTELSTKDVAGRWLELQYGWLPMLNDVYEAQKAYHRLTSGPRKMTFAVSVKRDSKRDLSTSPTNYSGWANCRGRIGIKAEIYETISAPRSLGLTDPASVLWEIIPYSFVVDWFIPIGSYLENLNVLKDLQGRFMTTRQVRFAYSGIPKNFLYYKDATCNGGGINLDRRISTSISVAKPGLTSLPDAMSPNRIWNAIALARQRFS